MKRLCFLAVLIALSFFGPCRPFDFIQRRQPSGAHRIRPGIAVRSRAPRCRSPERLNWRHKRDRYKDDRDVAVPAKPVPSAPQTISPPAPPATTAPAKTIVAAPPPAVYTTAASRSHIVDAPPPAAPPPVQEVSIPVPPAPSVEKPVETAQPAPQVERVTHQAEEEPSDSPIGDWQTEGKGTVRIGKVRQCAVRLRARFIEREGRSDPDQHEAEDGKAMDRRRLQPGLAARRITARCR